MIALSQVAPNARDRREIARRVVIVDDHPIVRDGLKQALGAAEDLALVGEAGDAPGALALLRRQGADVLVLDITLPGRSGIDLLRDLRRHWPQLPVLVLSVHAEDEFAVRAIRAGAAGYLQKDCAARDLVDAIRAIAAGHRYIRPSVAERLAQELQRGGGDDATRERLSDRELEVLRLIAAGKSGKEVAAALSVSKSTVSTYRARIFAKLGIHSNAEITRYALSHGLVT